MQLAFTCVYDSGVFTCGRALNEQSCTQLLYTQTIRYVTPLPILVEKVVQIVEKFGEFGDFKHV